MLNINEGIVAFVNSECAEVLLCNKVKIGRIVYNVTRRYLNGKKSKIPE